MGRGIFHGEPRQSVRIHVPSIFLLPPSAERLRRSSSSLQGPSLSVYRGLDKNGSIRSHEEQYFEKSSRTFFFSTLMKSNRDSSSIKAAITIVAEHGWNALHGGENAGPAQQIKEVDPFAEESGVFLQRRCKSGYTPNPK